VAADPHDVVALYERYLAACNAHRLDLVAELVSDEVGGSGADDGLAPYLRRIEVVLEAFPDYHWELQQRLVDGDTVVARLVGRGTHTGTFDGIAPTGRRIATQELVIYRFADGKIVRCWGDLFPVVRDALTTSGPVTT
jgi:predicted ester cyclase